MPPAAPRFLLRQVSAAGQALLDLVFPPRCPGCGKLGVLFCAACQAQIEPIPLSVCSRCGHPTSEYLTRLADPSGVAGPLCAACRTAPSNLDGIQSVAVFAHPLREAIHALKYGNCRDLAIPLGARMAEAWNQAHVPADLFMPVPLHARREAERGYNQSALLARVLGSTVGLPVVERALVRRKATLPQVGLNRDERHSNVSGAFVCREDLGGKRVVLVDDVCTTGATLEACAEALRAAGTGHVSAFTLARARWEPGEPAPDAAPQTSSSWP